MGNPTTIWASLALPYSAVGSIPFVDYDGLTITTDVYGLWYNDPANQLSVGTMNDRGGTDTLNLYYQGDSYWPWNLSGQNPLTKSQTSGWTVTSSRGTGTAPLVSQDQDFIGKYSGWAFTGNPFPLYQEIAGINIYASGNFDAVAGLGGSLRLFTKQNNSAQVEWIELDQQGRLHPVAPLVLLGKPNNGGAGSNPVNSLSYYGLYLAYQLMTPGQTTVNTPMGKVIVLAGQSQVVVTNNLVSTNSIIHGMQETNDVTANGIKSITPSNGSFTIRLNAACTQNTAVNFIVWRTDT